MNIKIPFLDNILDRLATKLLQIGVLLCQIHQKNSKDYNNEKNFSH